METLQMFYTKMWTREATSSLIQHYQANECLWMTTSPLYRNKNKRIEALKKIAIEVSKYRPQSTSEDIKNKINGIRTQYVSEINKLILAGNKGEQYEPTLWCFEILSFLKPFTQPKQRPPNSWNRNIMPKPFKPSFIQRHNQQNPNRHFQASTFNEEQKKDCILVKHEPEQEIEDDIEIIEEEDTLITDEEYGSPAYHPEEEEEEVKQTKDALVEEQTSTTSYKQKSPTTYIDSATEESSDEQRVRRLFSPSRMNTSEITLVPKKDLVKRKDDCCQKVDGIEDKKRRIEETKKEEEDKIQIFGKFVMSQMRTIANHVLLIKLEHTIQNAIIEAQLKQIELDSKQNEN